MRTQIFDKVQSRDVTELRIISYRDQETRSKTHAYFKAESQYCDMESGERLSSPSSVSSSLHMAFSSASSSPASPHKPSTKCSPDPNRAGSSPQTTCGPLLQMNGDACLNPSGEPNSFPLVAHPAFGLFPPSLGQSQFGGLGSLGLSAFAANPQFGTFPDWFWRYDARTGGAASFSVPPLGLHPVFTPVFKSQDPAHSQSRTSVSVGVNGTVNGRSSSCPTGNSAGYASSFPAKANKDRTKANIHPKSIQDPGQLNQKSVQKTKEKKPSKRPLETSSMSGSQSGSLSDSSSDGEDSSSDADDMELDEEEDDDEDEDDQSNDSDDSDSETERQVKQDFKRLTKNTLESKNRRGCVAEGNATQDSRRGGVSLTSSHHIQSPHPAGRTQSVSITLFLEKSRTADEDRQKHISVIQATGLAAISSSPSSQSNREVSPLPSSSSPKPISFSNSPKHLPPASPKPFSHSSSPQHISVSSSPKPLALCSPLKPLSLGTSPKRSFLSLLKLNPLSSLPKPPTPLATQKPSHKQRGLMPSSKHTQPVDNPKESSGNPDEISLHRSSFKLRKRVHAEAPLKQPFSLQLSSQNCNDTNLFLNPCPNGAFDSEVQNAPLPLKMCRMQSSTLKNKPLVAAISPSCLMPINLSTGTKEPTDSASLLKSTASPRFSHGSRKTKSPKSLHAGRSLLKTNSSCPLPVELVRSSESDIHSSKDSNSDSLGDDCDEDEEDDLEEEDSGSSLSESQSESNLESDSVGAEDDMKERAESEADSDAESTPLNLAKAPLSACKSSSSLSANCSLLNHQVITPPSLSSSLLNPNTLSSLGALSNHSTPSSSVTLTPLPGSGKRRRVTDERVLKSPLEFGWQRETRIRSVAGRLQGEVAYFAPCGKKLRQYPDVTKYLVRNGITEISRDNFSFSTKIKVGAFYEAREGPEGPQWFLLAEEEITPIIIAMDGRRSRRLKSEHQPSGDDSGGQRWKNHPLNVGENNFQNINNAKLRRKLEAQEMARLVAQIKLMRKLEKQAMAQAAKEARRQKAIMAAEERRKKREQVKILEQQKKIKRSQQMRMEKELRAQQILEVKRQKQQEAANARLLEAEKRNKDKEMQRLQAVMLKQQELERHRLDMETERRRQHMMLMKAVEIRKKAEEKDRLKQQKTDEKRQNKERKLQLRRLELEKAKALKKPNEDMCLSDLKCLPELSRIPGLVLQGSTLSDCLMVLQFLHSFGKVLRLDNLNNLDLSVLQAGLLNSGGSMGKVQDLLVSMVSSAVQDPGIPAGHRRKTCLGVHLTNVAINRDNVSEILQIYMEAHCDQTESAALALSLRTKAFQAHSPSQKVSMLCFLVNELCCSKAVISEIDKNMDHMTNLRKDKWAVERKLCKLRSTHTKRTEKRDSSVGGDDSLTFDDDSEDQADDDDEEEEDGGKKGAKAEICEEEDDSVNSASVEELEKQIEKLCMQQSQITQKLLHSSQSQRSMMIGQDRYKRRYWLLPECGGIFVEGMESSEGYEELKERQETAQVIRIKEEQLEETKMECMSSPAPSTDRDKATDTSGPYPLCSPQLKGSPWITSSPQPVLQEDQLTRTLMEKSSQWFSLLPRSPCDELSVTSGSSPRAASSSPHTMSTKSPSSLSPNPPATAGYNAPAGINNMHSPVLQQVKSGIHQSGLTLCDVSSAATSPSLPSPGTSLPPVLDLSSQHAVGSGSGVLLLVNNNTVNKLETPEALCDKPACALFPAVEAAKTQDYPRPQPIPEEMLHGWWRVSDVQELHSLVEALHSRGIREKVLQKQFQKHMEYLTQLYANSEDAFDVAKLEKREVSEKTLESWCVEEQAMEVDISQLQQVEALERRVVSAGLQIKGWMHPEPQSEREDLVYQEDKLLSSPAPENKWQRETSPEKLPGSVVRRPNNPLDIAVMRLAELEGNIDRSSEEEVSPGMRLWHKALGEVRSSAQLSLCIQQLQKSIDWDRPVMKVHCHRCQNGDNEELLLLCDGCDKGCHTYCHRPKISTVPDGKWYCHICVAKESGQLRRSRKQQNRTAVGEMRGRAKLDSPGSCAKKAKLAKDDRNWLEMCRVLLAELEAHQDAQPFLTPVDHKAVPWYKKIIKKPMDFSTIREKLSNNQYLHFETFIMDVNLVFDNCEKYNEDDSKIGRAGHNLKEFFDKRWTELLKKN
ncbi:bromodomain adjacent to zinc finger domain protein 2B-like isoform X1 [Platichthys flesus]|uniref:bromodomain adjacent to zinc finger domain protein 2B-like isoform X1 n=1 Tax=Platichthys flesus TaxID=8260 RepID=UPI002DBD37F8|nr:bromodomain adjacent to zinc finger domain protein 2B-like isoform X1 [Platichthys flesus]